MVEEQGGQEGEQVEEQEEEEQERGEDLAPGCSTARPPPQVPTFTNTTKGGDKTLCPTISTKINFHPYQPGPFQGHPI